MKPSGHLHQLGGSVFSSLIHVAHCVRGKQEARATKSPRGSLQGARCTAFRYHELQQHLLGLEPAQLTALNRPQSSSSFRNSHSTKYFAFHSAARFVLAHHEHYASLGHHGRHCRLGWLSRRIYGCEDPPRAPIWTSSAAATASSGAAAATSIWSSAASATSATAATPLWTPAAAASAP